ncbi:MAG: NUDIX domain-containing protein [Arenicellales bacterium]
MKWSIINKKQLYRGFFGVSGFKLKHELFDGGESAAISRECLDRGQAAAVLPYDPLRDEVVLIEQFRIGAIDDPSGPWLIEIIAGLREEGESAEDLIHREAEEEAGCKLSNLIPIHKYYSSPGGSNEQIQIYFARADTTGPGGIYGLDEEGEDIRVHIISSDTAFEWLDQGRIDSALPIIALQWFRLNRDTIREQWLKDREPSLSE